MPEINRPTKKQFLLLEFVKNFISQHGYGPSYREIMNGCNYNSVATVAVHINNLINKGYLSKKGRSARSLEVVDQNEEPEKIATNQVKPAEEKWLIELIDYKFNLAENSGSLNQSQVDELYVLVGALKVLGLEGASHSFMPRLKAVKDKLG